MIWIPSKVAKRYRLRPEIYPFELEAAVEIALFFNGEGIRNLPDTIYLNHNSNKYLIELIYGKTRRNFDFKVMIAPRDPRLPFYGIAIPDERQVFDIYDKDISALVEYMTDGKSSSGDVKKSAVNKDAIRLTVKGIGPVFNKFPGMTFDVYDLGGERYIYIGTEENGEDLEIGVIRQTIFKYEVFESRYDSNELDWLNPGDYDWKGLIKEALELLLSY